MKKLSPHKGPFQTSLGKRGEMLAWDYLRQRGYQILHKNYRCKIGEIDIVAKKNNRIHFFEVKTRSSRTFGLPQEAVGFMKQAKLIRLAQWYLKDQNLKDCPISFDVLAVSWSPNSSAIIRLLSQAFEVEEAHTF